MADVLPDQEDQNLSRDFRKLHVFDMADELLMAVYSVSATFPADERFGLTSQLRRAALSIPVNIVEGSARRTLREYVNFLNVAAGSAAETQYLLTVARRLGYHAKEVESLETGYEDLLKGLRAMLRGLGGTRG